MRLAMLSRSPGRLRAGRVNWESWLSTIRRMTFQWSVRAPTFARPITRLAADIESTRGPVIRTDSERRDEVGRLAASFIEMRRNLDESFDAIQTSEHRFRNLVEGSIQGILVFDDDEILFANSALAKMLGFNDPKEVMALSSTYQLFARHEEDRLSRKYRMYSEGASVSDNYEVDGLSKQGQTLRLMALARKVDWGGRQAVQASLVDVTERHRATEALRENEMLLLRTASLSGLGYAVWDETENSYLSVSEGFAAVFGLSQQEFISRYSKTRLPFDLIHSEDQYRYRIRTGSRLVTKAQGNVGFRILRGDNEVRYASEHTDTLLDDSGRPTRSLIVLQDITEQMVTRERLHQSDKSAALGGLTGGIAHDFNNLLGIIAGNAELLENEFSRRSPSINLQPADSKALHLRMLFPVIFGAR